MKHTTHIATVGLVLLTVCALGLTSAAGTKKQVTRPYKITGVTVGEITAVTATPTDYSITFNLVNVGEATHCGRYSNVGRSTLSLLTHTGTTEGTFTAANGDTVNWVGTIAGTTLTVTVTGGTGRFADGSGGFVAEIGNLVLDPMPPAVGGTVAYTFEGTGTATY
jgi:hypothetical protein